MKLVNGRGSVRLITALAAVALTLAGSALVANPAHADEAPEEATHCVITFSETSQKECFATYDEAKAHVTSVVGSIPDHEAPIAQRVGATSVEQRSSALLIPVLIYVGYDLPYFDMLGGSIWFISMTSCTPPLFNIDYSLANLGGMNNKISSFRTYSGCRAKHYALPLFSGPSTSYSTSQAVMGGGASSILIS